MWLPIITDYKQETYASLTIRKSVSKVGMANSDVRTLEMSNLNLPRREQTDESLNPERGTFCKKTPKNWAENRQIN